MSIIDTVKDVNDLVDKIENRDIPAEIFNKFWYINKEADARVYKKDFIKAMYNLWDRLKAGEIIGTEDIYYELDMAIEYLNRPYWIDDYYYRSEK